MRECCETCKYFEDWRKTDLSGIGLCEYDMDTIGVDPHELTCFNWEPKEEEEE